jgi:hypothetical protein
VVERALFPPGPTKDELEAQEKLLKDAQEAHRADKAELLKCQATMEARAIEDAAETTREKTRVDYTAAVNSLGRALAPMMTTYLNDNDIAPLVERINSTNARMVNANGNPSGPDTEPVPSVQVSILRARITQLETEKAVSATSRDRQLQNISADNLEKVNKHRKNERTAQDALTKLKGEHRDAIAQLKTTHEQAIAQQTADHARKLDQQQAAHYDAMNKYANETNGRRDSLVARNRRAHHDASANLDCVYANLRHAQHDGRLQDIAITSLIQRHPLTAQDTVHHNHLKAIAEHRKKIPPSFKHPASVGTQAPQGPQAPVPLSLTPAPDPPTQRQ